MGKILFNNMNVIAELYFFLTLCPLGLELSIMELLNIIVTERVRSLYSNKMYFGTDFYSLV